MAVIFIVGGLILLKGVTTKRVYKNWLLDVMETAIYFNLVVFSALTWYNLDFQREPGCCSLYDCHDHFCPLIGGRCLSCLTLHQTL